MSEDQTSARDEFLKAIELKVMPTVAQRVVQMINSEDTTAEQLERVLIGDPALTSKILRMANSPYYGLPKEVKTLAMGIVVLGFKTLKTLVLAAATRSLFNNPSPEEQRLWEHSLAAGITCRMMAHQVKGITPDEAFILGLFHDLGKVIINTVAFNKYQFLQRRSRKFGTPLYHEEERVFRVTSAELGGMLLRKWHMDDAVATAIELQFAANPPPAFFQTPPGKMVALIHASDFICEFLGHGYDQPNEEIEKKKYPGLSHLPLSEQQLLLVIEKVDHDFKEERDFFT